MTSLRIRLATAISAAAIAITSFVPAQSMPMTAQPVANAGSGVTEVQYRRHHRDRHYREGYYNGHRGYRERRRGYRYHNGYWFPLAAFATGAIIGGAVTSQSSGASSRHYQWCENRYRTYRASDNTYVASGGVRRSCNSPYN